MSDHGILQVISNFQFCYRKFSKSNWKCLDFDMCKLWAAEHFPSVPTNGSPVTLTSFLITCRDIFSDHLPCRVRRYNRMPLQLRSLYNIAYSCADLGVRKKHLAQAWALRKDWLRGLVSNAQKASIDRGRVLSRSKQLFKLESLVSCDEHGLHSTIAEDDVSISSHVADCFGERWGARDLPRIQEVTDFLSGSNSHMPELHVEDFVLAFAALRRADKLDADGICQTT